MPGEFDKSGYLLAREGQGREISFKQISPRLTQYYTRIIPVRTHIDVVWYDTVRAVLDAVFNDHFVHFFFVVDSLDHPLNNVHYPAQCEG